MWSANVMFVNREDPQINYCRLKAYIIFTFLCSFRKSGKPQPIGTKVGIHIHRSRQGPTTFTKFWARSAKWGRNGGLKIVFFCKQYKMTFRQLRNGRFSPNLATTRKSWLKVETQILDGNLCNVFIQGSFAPKTPNLKGVRQIHHSEQVTGQGMHCREILFTRVLDVVVQLPRARDFARCVQLFCTTYGCGATGRQNCPVFGFWANFSRTKRLKSTFW